MEFLTDPEKDQIKRKAMKISNFAKNKTLVIMVFETLGALILSFGIAVTEYKHPISRKQLNPSWVFLISCFNFLAISIAGPFSGGHINPAVTISQFTAKIIKKQTLIAYFGSQIVGALLGTLIYYAFFQQTPQIYTQVPSFGDLVLDALGEMVGTFIFVFGVIYACYRQYMKGEPFKYFFISLMFLVGRIFAWRRGFLNPAIAIAYQLFAAFENSSFLLFLSCFGIVIGSMIGGVLASYFYYKFYDPLLTEMEKHNM